MNLHGLHRFAGDHLAADRRLYGDFEKLAGNHLGQFFRHTAAAGIGLVTVHDYGESVAYVAVKHHFQLDQIAFLIAFQFVVKTGVPAGTTLELVEKVEDDLVQRNVIIQLDAPALKLHGEGKIVKDKCTACGGSGRVRKRRTATVKVPAGIDDGQTIVMRGQGEPGSHGGPSGDLYVRVTVRPHKLFRRDGTTLLLDLPITISQAALGADLDVPTLKQTVKYRIPEGTQNDTEFRLKGYGLPNLRGGGTGDLLVRVKVEVPKKLSEKQKELLRQFENSTTGREYEGKKSFVDKLKGMFP